MSSAVKRWRNRWIALAGLVVVLISEAVEELYGSIFMIHPDLYSLAAAAVLVFAASLFSEVTGIAAAVFEILLGSTAPLVGVPTTETLDTLGLVGSVFIMFMAGLEIESSLLRRNLWRSMLAGLASFAAPMAVSYIGLSLLGYTRMESLLAGIAVSTTSVAVVYAILRRGGWLRLGYGQFLLSIAMVADVASIIAFVAVVSSASIGMTIYFIAVIVAPFILAELIKRLPRGESKGEVRVIIAVLLAASLVSDILGVHAILFAFLLGIALREQVIRDRGLFEGLSTLTFGFFAPIFFVNAGMHAVPREPLLYLSLSLILLILSYPPKAFATWMAVKTVSGRDPGRIPLVFGARLTVSTVVAFAGLQSGVLSQVMAGSIILSALVATLVSALAVKAPVSSEEL